MKAIDGSQRGPNDDRSFIFGRNLALMMFKDPYFNTSLVEDADKCPSEHLNSEKRCVFVPAASCSWKPLKPLTELCYNVMGDVNVSADAR